MVMDEVREGQRSVRWPKNPTGEYQEHAVQVWYATSPAWSPTSPTLPQSAPVWYSTSPARSPSSPKSPQSPRVRYVSSPAWSPSSPTLPQSPPVCYSTSPARSPSSPTSPQPPPVKQHRKHKKAKSSHKTQKKFRFTSPGMMMACCPPPMAMCCPPPVPMPRMMVYDDASEGLCEEESDSADADMDTSCLRSAPLPPACFGQANLMMETESESKKKKSSDPLMALIDLQEFEGYWNLDDELAACVKQNIKDIKSKGQGKEDTVWATALAVACFRKTYGAKKDEWEMIEKKAMDWLVKKLGSPSNSEALITEAASFI